mmetsp:Transcript_13446/g.19584  ORF Transcript_13446/g.19584 Transcript_13446/m.19584 type:complete len:265 (-) Transcript_13446:109-903(-)
MFHKSIFQLMKKGKWDQVRTRLDKLLSENDAEPSSRSSSSSSLLRSLKRELSSHDFSMQNALLRCLSFKPPLDIVESIIELYPQQVKETDYFGATALHVANLGCDIDVIERLIELNPKAAVQRDIFYRTPLVYAVFSNSSLDKVATVCQAAPSVLLIPDEEGHYPIDHAKLTSESVVYMIQGFSKIYRERCEAIEASMEDDITNEELERIANLSFGWTKGTVSELFSTERPNSSVWTDGDVEELCSIDQPQNQPRRRGNNATAA